MRSTTLARNLTRLPLLALCCLAYSLQGASHSVNDPEALKQRDLPIAQLAQGFENPPAEARPFMRWWWNDNRVEAEQVLRELDIMSSVGIGGVEINPVSASETNVKSRVKPLEWRSKEWDEVLHVASKGARERGMIVDLIAGSGWPFGGRFLKPEERIMRLVAIDHDASGPETVSFSWAQIESSARKSIQHGDKGEVDLYFVKLYPKGITDIAQVIDITDQVERGDTLEIAIPEGDYVVSFGVLQRGYRHVMVGTKGADGPTMDHYDREVTRSYLNRLKGAEETWGEPLSTYIRAIFCDSIETAAANWTHGMASAFQEKIDYDIAPFLPFVLAEESESEKLTETPFMDQIRRARYDWTSFLGATFLDNFVREFSQFCHDNGLLSRYQAYGTPWLISMAEGYMIPDIPESNNWIRQDPYLEDRFTHDQSHGYMTWTKYASAAGRLNGKRIVSTEGMTTVRERFERTLSTIKQADDMNFITGITHTVLHGFNSVPSDIPFPGLVRYGSFFSEYNTWWPYLARWVDYNARLSYVMQNTRSTSEIAIIGPSPDLWSRKSFNRAAFHLTPEYLHLLWEPISQLGGDCDYLHGDIIENAHLSKGLIQYGPTNYSTLIVVEMETMRPETAEAIQRFAESGGRVAFVGNLPNRSPSLVEAQERGDRVSQAIQAALTAGAIQVAPPTDNHNLRQWVTDTLQTLNVTLPLTVETPRDGLYQLRKQAAGEDFIFITNTYQLESSRTRVSFDLGKRGLWRWNPETGQRTPYDLPYDATGFEIDLRPVESILLVTGEKQAPAIPRRISSEDLPSWTIDTPWNVTFLPAQESETFSIKLGPLTDFTKIDDDRIASFSGTAIYETVIELDTNDYANLDLGWDNAAVTEVFINDQQVGTNWYGSKLFPLAGYLKDGANTIRVKYTTTLNNKMKQLKQPSGLIGPVRLIKDPRSKLSTASTAGAAAGHFKYSRMYRDAAILQ